jgi:hypothetical protein
MPRYSGERSLKKGDAMKKQFALALFMTLLALVALWAADVKTDYDHQTDFGQYRTYSWIKVQAGDTLWADRIQRDIDEQLTSKGWNKVASNGDAGVAAFGSTHNQQTLQTFYDGFGGGWFWRGFGGPGVATTTVENTPVGTLVVDIFDGRSKKLIWRGVGADALSSKVEKNEKKLENTVEDMFKRFPPKAKG